MTYMDWASGYYHPPFELVDWECLVESVVLETPEKPVASASPKGSVTRSAAALSGRTTATSSHPGKPAQAAGATGLRGYAGVGR